MSASITSPSSGNLLATAAVLEQVLCALITASEGEHLTAEDARELQLGDDVLDSLRSATTASIPAATKVARWASTRAEMPDVRRRRPAEYSARRVRKALETVDALRQSALTGTPPPRQRNVRYARRVVGDVFAAVVGQLE